MDNNNIDHIRVELLDDEHFQNKLSIENNNRLTKGCTNLMYACQQGLNGDIVKELRTKPRTVYLRDNSNKTALHYCSGQRDLVAAASVAIAAPDLLESADEDGFTPLHLAVIQGNIALVNLLLANKADVNVLDNEGHSVVHWATVCGEVNALRAVLAAGADVSTPDINGGSPLHYAAQMCGANYDGKPGQTSAKLALEILKIFLLHPKTVVDVTDKDGRQPILWAASAGSAQAVLALVKAGARVESSDKDGLTALHCAASRGHTECIDTLISLCGAPTDLIDSNGCTALHYAVTLGHADATALLLNLEADPNRQDRKGRTPAHCGCAKGQFETVKMLKDRNGNMWLRNAKGDLPIHEAACSGRLELVQWLLDQKQKQVNTTSNDGRALIHIAAGNDNTDMCKMLLDCGADVNSIHRVEGNMVQTPLDCALQKGYRSTAKFLQLNGGLPASKLRLSGRKPNALNDQELVTPLNFTESKNLDTVKSPCKSKEYLVYLKKTGSEEYHCIDEVPKYSNKSIQCSECHYYHHNHCSALDSHNGKQHIHHHHRRKHRRRTSSCETYGKHKDDSSSDICRSKSNIEIRRQKKINSKYDSSSSLCSECDFTSSDSDTYHRRINDRQHHDHQHHNHHHHHHHQHQHQQQHQQKQRRKDRSSTSKKSKSLERYYSSDNESDNKDTKKRKRKEKKKCKKDIALAEEKPNDINETNNVSNEKSNVSTNKQMEANHEISGEKSNKPEFASQSRPSSTKSTSASIKRPSSARVTSAQKRQQSKGKFPKETTETPEKEQSSSNTIIEADNSNPAVETAPIVDDDIINVSDKHPKITNDFEVMEEDEVKIETIVTRADVHTVDAHLNKSEPDQGKSEIILDENNDVKKDIEEVLTDSTYIVEKPSDGKEELNKSPEEILQNNENVEINQSTTKIEDTLNENKEEINNEQETEGISNIDTKTETTIPDVSIQESTPITSPALTIDQVSPTTAVTTTIATNVLEKSVIQENLDTDLTPLDETIPLVLPTNQSENNNKQIIDEVVADENEENSTQSNIQKSESQSFSILPDNLEITDVCHPIENKPIRKSSFTVLISDESIEQLDDILVTTSSIELEQNKSFTVLSAIENDNDIEQYYSTDDPDVIMQDIDDGRITHSAIDQAGRRKRLKKRAKSVKQKSAEGSLNRQNNDKITMIQQSKDQDSGFEPSPRALRTKIPSPRQAHTAYSPRKSSFTMLDGRSCSSRIEGRKPGDKDSVNMTTVTQSIQRNIKRYYMERKIFQHLLELKSLQIRSSKIHESILVKRAVDDYHKSTVALGLETGGSLKRYPYKDYTFKNFEIFLYETLKSLQKNGTHNFQNISDVYKEAERRLSPDYSRCEKALHCTTKTHRCLHAAHAYTGIPCAAYIPMMNHHTMPKYGFGPLKNTGVGSFYLPKILTKNAKFGNKVSLELTHGNSKQLISLPSEKLDSNKRYYVTFTVKGNNDDLTNNVNEQIVEDEQQQHQRSRSNSKNENDIIKENI